MQFFMSEEAEQSFRIETIDALKSMEINSMRPAFLSSLPGYHQGDKAEGT